MSALTPVGPGAPGTDVEARTSTPTTKAARHALIAQILGKRIAHEAFEVEVRKAE